MAEFVWLYFGGWSSGYQLDTVWTDESDELMMSKNDFDWRWFSEYLWLEMSFDGEFFECKNVLAWYSDVQTSNKLSF